MIQGTIAGHALSWDVWMGKGRKRRERDREREGRDKHRKEEYGKMKGEAGEGASVSVLASKAFQTFAVQML